MIAPTDLRSAAFAALCEDIATGNGFQRTNALREINKQWKSPAGEEGRRQQRCPTESR